MNDSQDIFLLLLVILFMANSDSDYQTVNSVILMLLLFSTFESRSANNAGTNTSRNRNCCTSR